MELYTHQKECISNITKIFDDDEKNGLIKMFCGSGKSFVIYHSILEFGSNLSIIVVPSINLISQFNNDYLFDKQMKDYNERKFNKEFDIMTICSKNELKEKDFSKEIKLTTEPEKITDFLLNEEDKLILITYQSLETLFEVLKENSINVDLICFDEAHHICGDKTKELLFENEYVDEYVDKMLFFTATPVNKNKICMYNPPTEITINDENYEIIDDNNSFIDDDYDEEISHCGSMIYEYMHKKGVYDNRLNDFQVRVDLYTENTDKSVFEAMSRSILETGNSRVLTFHSRSETESDKGTNVNDFSKKSNLTEFKKIFDKVQKSEFPELKDKYKNIYFEGITASTPNRRKILDKFDETKDTEIFILASCKTIGEGVDTKNANMVCFVDSKQSYVEIVQNIGRICRKNKNTKQKATVLIPSWVDKEKYKDCKGNPKERDKIIREDMNKGGNFNGILNVLSALRQEDPYVFELCLKYPEVYTLKELKDNFKKEGLELDDKKYDIKEVLKEYNVKFDNKKTEEENFNKLSKQLDINVQITNQKILEEDIIIDNKSDDWLYFVKTEDNKYMITNTKEKIKKKDKIDRPHRNIKPFCHVNPNVEVLWDFTSDVNLNKGIFGGFIEATVKVDSEAMWIEKLELVKKYIDENKIRPSYNDDKILCNWLGIQIKNYNKNILKNNRKKLWIDFINNPKYKNYFLSNEEQWNKKIELVIKYIDINKKRPSQTDSDINIKKLGQWFTDQIYNYKKEIMNNINIYNKFDIFYKKNIKLLDSNDNKWYENLKQLIEFIEKYKKRPKSKTNKKLEKWLSHQIINYNNKKDIMNNIIIRNEWEKFYNKYKNLLKSKEEQWVDYLNFTMKYIDENDKRPSNSDKDSNIKFYATWISNQIKNYENNEQIMRINKYKKLWENFNEKYKEYFKSPEEIWFDKLNQVISYIKDNNKRPNDRGDDNNSILGRWINTQSTNYNKKERSMKNTIIKKKWEEFITEYQQYFPDNPAIQKPIKKSIDIKPKKESLTKETDEQRKQRKISEYQELTKKMSIQKSDNTNKMFKDKPELWEQYHEARDFSFQGYEQDEIPVNKIISYLETKKNHRLKILDLGCGRNLIKEHFKDNKKFTITGYDHISYNGSKVSDISNLEDEEEDTIDVCVYSQSLMGSNWKEYLDEGKYVLRYNGEMIISESSERHEIIKNYLIEIDMKIIKEEYNETKRWFYINVIKQ